jgi:hypothetical protein
VRTVATVAARGCEAIASAAHVARSTSSAAGATSDTRPTWCARSAESRSWLPSSVMRMSSPKGMRRIIDIGSYTAGIP